MRTGHWTVYANSFVACLNARSMFPIPIGSVDSAIFSSVPDISVRSNGSVIAASCTPIPHSGFGRPASVSRISLLQITVLPI